MPEKKKVLVVDDQYVARSFFEIHVEMTRKYELVASLASAEQAIAYCLQNPVDLVIMDVMMKYGLDGLTCARTIKNNDPRVRIILTTSTAEAKWIEWHEKAQDDNRAVAQKPKQDEHHPVGRTFFFYLARPSSQHSGTCRSK